MEINNYVKKIMLEEINKKDYLFCIFFTQICIYLILRQVYESRVMMKLRAWRVSASDMLLRARRHEATSASPHYSPNAACYVTL